MEEVFVDIPVAIDELVQLEARAATRILEPLRINRRVKVKPLLTPDDKGEVYSKAVLDLIESAQEQLLFQIPYINSFKAAATGFLEELVNALIGNRSRSRTSASFCAQTTVPGSLVPRISKSGG